MSSVDSPRERIVLLFIDATPIRGGEVAFPCEVGPWIGRNWTHEAAVL